MNFIVNSGVICGVCGYAMVINLEQGDCYCETSTCTIFNKKFEIPSIQLKEKKLDLKELEKLYNTIERLYKENVPTEIYTMLNNLSNGCVWSRDAFKIIKNANDVLNDVCKDSKGVWR